MDKTGTDTYEIELHLLRQCGDSRTDRLHKLVVNGSAVAHDGKKHWTVAVQQWLNSVGVKTRATSMRSLEAAALNSGYEWSFIEQYEEIDADWRDHLASPAALGELREAHLVRRYRMTMRPETESRHDLRYALIKTASNLIRELSEKDLTSDEIRECVTGACRQLDLLTTGRMPPSDLRPYERKSESIAPDPGQAERNGLLCIGDIVHHPFFGPGKVLGKETQELLVEFKEHGEKRLSIEFAPLRCILRAE